ncbi:MAG: hypothetical protein ACREMZ_16915 [Gemmatimonadales bacterium]
MLAIEAGVAVFVGQVAHVVAAVEGGPRGKVPTPVNRDAFSNLIVLCYPCHRIIDNDALREKYPPKLLMKWKRDREREFDATTLAELDELGSVFTALPAMLVEVMKQTSAELRETVTRLEAAGQLTHRSAEVLIRAVDTLPSESTVGDLALAAQRLYMVSELLPADVLKASGDTLTAAAELLSASGVSNAAEQLHDAAQVLTQDNALSQLQHTASEIQSMIESLPDLESYRDLVTRMERAALRPSPAARSREDATPWWPDFREGCLGVMAVVAVVLLIGAGIGWWLTDQVHADQQEEREACTGAKPPRGFRVTRPVEVEGSPSVSPSPYTWRLSRSSWNLRWRSPT